MIIIICALAALTAITALGLYAFKFGFGFASKISDWGAVGDFFGGILNPTFALLSLILIAYTLMQNKKALEQSEIAIEQGTKAIEQNEKALQVSNKELELTRNELANSSKALEEQASLLAIQSFETTFFNMLELHSKNLEKVTFDIRSSFSKIKNENKGTIETSFASDYKVCNGSEAFIPMAKLIRDISNQKSTMNFYNLFYQYEGKTITTYFHTLYQILVMIDDAFFDKIEKEKYVSILKSQISNQELTILMLNSLSLTTDNEKFNSLIIKYSLLQNLDIIYNSQNNIILIGGFEIVLPSDEINSLSKFNNNKLIESAFGKTPKSIPSSVYAYYIERGFIK